jgi:putative zinc finger/helix-turn-helix YgiT family protein
MKCPNCGARMTASKEDYHYEESGLPNVFLRGVEVRRCGECDEVEVVIPGIEKLHREIATIIVERTDRLAPPETRFLRKWLGLSGVDLAALMGVAKETISRWENGREPMGAVAERLLRLLVEKLGPVDNYPVDILKKLQETHAATPLTFETKGKRWARIAA